ncbi:MAG TPA: hypothetical protein VHF89_08335 [Solirubrobacteraceae bacterium]|nr:hypothetical protein [Solirubrobacteraceae bacterium]
MSRGERSRQRRGRRSGSRLGRALTSTPALAIGLVSSVLGIVGFVLASTGTDDPETYRDIVGDRTPPLAHHDLVYRADRLCAVRDRATEEFAVRVHEAEDRGDAAAAAEANIRDYDAFIEALRKLTPNDQDRPAYEKYVSAQSLYADAFSSDLRDLLARRRRGGGIEAAPVYLEASEAAAKELGFKVCERAEPLPADSVERVTRMLQRAEEVGVPREEAALIGVVGGLFGYCGRFARGELQEHEIAISSDSVEALIEYQRKHPGKRLEIPWPRSHRAIMRRVPDPDEFPLRTLTTEAMLFELGRMLARCGDRLLARKLLSAATEAVE